MTRVLVLGVTGQIGSYIAELYLQAGYKVYGTMRRSGIDKYDNIENIKDQIELHIADIYDPFSLLHSFRKTRPNIVINCAAQSEVGTSFDNPGTTFDITGKGVLNILELIRLHYPKTKFLQFSSSEMFGDQFSLCGSKKIQDENTKMNPLSPYAVAKLAGYNMVRVYRKSYGLFASNIIAFNSESPRRKDYFVTRKITKWLGEYITWKEREENLRGSDLNRFQKKNPNYIYSNNTFNKFPKLALGNIDSVRSWTHSKDTARAAQKILDHNTPDDFCVGREECHTIKDFLSASFSYKNLNWNDYVYQDPQFMRPNDLTYLNPCVIKAKNMLGWKPTVTFDQLVQEMVDVDCEKAQKSK